jgi:hypothetical protein
MSDRVLSSGQAREAIQQLQRILSSDLQAQITALTNAANTLSQPDVWDGRLATQFRTSWPDQQKVLAQARDALEHLLAMIESYEQQTNQTVPTIEELQQLS